MRTYTIIALLFISAISNVFPQAEKVNALLKMVADGKIEEVKDELLDLLAEYPNDPGVQLLHGVVIDDAFRAVEIYKRIIKEHPQSQWADNAYWRIIQFYAILGDTEQAQIYLEKFKQQFPTSELLAPSADVVNSSRRLLSSGIKSTPSNKAEEKSKQTETIASKESEKKADDSQAAAQKSASVYFGLQVAVFKDKESANAEMNKFLKQRMRTVVLEKVVGGEKLFAVVIGDYSSKESAEAAKQIVEQQCSCKPIIFEK